MKLSAKGLIGILIWLVAGSLAVPSAYASCFGSQSQLTCHDNLTGNIYNSRTYRPPAASQSSVKKRFGWMPIQSQKKLGDLTIIGDIPLEGSAGRRTAEPTLTVTTESSDQTPVDPCSAPALMGDAFSVSETNLEVATFRSGRLLTTDVSLCLEEL